MTLDIINPGVDTNFSTKLNNNFNATKVVEMYSGTGLNVACDDNGGAPSLDTASYEFSEITSTELSNASYVHVVVAGTSDRQGRSYGYTKVKVEIKEIGGTYTTLIDGNHSYFAGEIRSSQYNDFGIIHGLTAGEKTNGVQIKVTTTCGVGYDSGSVESASFTHTQSILRLEA